MAVSTSNDKHYITVNMIFRHLIGLYFLKVTGHILMGHILYLKKKKSLVKAIIITFAIIIFHVLLSSDLCLSGLCGV